MNNKTSLFSILAFLAAAVGALTAFALYLRRREQELDEYEKLLFSDEYDEDDDAPATDDVEEEFVMPTPAEEETPAEDEEKK